MNSMAPRSRRKRQSRMRRGAAAIGCCLAAAAATASVSAANVPLDVKVEPNNSPRKNEKRRRLEQDYYRRLDASQKQEQADNSLGEADETASAVPLGSNTRRLPASVHKKGREYSQSQPGVHKKGNGDSSEDEPRGFVPMQSSNKNNNDPTPASESSEDDPPPRPAPAQTQNKNEKDNGLEPNERLATNLRKFTRIGGRGYALPPEKRYPYMASLQLEGHSPTAGEYDMHVCGGILVAPDLIMSAAHCANYSPAGTDETYQAFNGIEVGKTDLSDEGAKFDPYSLETYKLYYENLVPDKVHIHPHFDEETYENDIMLIKVFGQSRFPPVKIAEGKPPNRNIVALGWGAENASSSKMFSDKLKSAQMDLLSNNECRKIDVEVTDPITEKKSIMSLRDHVFDDMMCAKSNQRHICYGDAGGPAIYPGEDYEEDQVYGILSWGYGCVKQEYPAVMSRVPDHYDWIRRTICRESSDPPEQYGCPPKGMTTFSSGTVKVTLKLKMDMMAVETGFVVEVKDTRQVVAQRGTGYYKSEKFGNEIVKEEMDLPADTCFRLILLDSFGDGMCCDMGGGSGVLYWGTDVSYYTGVKLAEVNGSFEFDGSAEFCTRDPTNSIQAASTSTHDKGPPPSPPTPPSPPRTPRPQTQTKRPTRRPTRPTPRPVRPPQPSPSGSDTGGGGGGGTGGNQGSGYIEWSGPVTNPEFSYCTQFCSSSSHGRLCGNYECIHIPDEIATSDAGQVMEEGTETSEDSGGDEIEGTSDGEEEEEEGELEGTADNPFTSTEFYEEDSEYYLTVQFQFDDHPEEISWVLYDLTVNEVKVFVDFDEYPREEYAKQVLDIVVTVDGPDEGEKNYAFTVYDKASNGLCCDNGEGYYKVFLGETEDDLELMGDEEFDFSSSYYFTLFEMEGQGAELETDTPTLLPTKRPTKKPSKQPSKRPSNKPTKQPTKRPSGHPTERPTEFPTGSPITEKPTFVWEKRRPENMDAIGARWNTRINTPHGVFNDIGGDQSHYKFDEDGVSIRSGARDSLSRRGGIFVAGMVLISSLVLATMH